VLAKRSLNLVSSMSNFENPTQNGCRSEMERWTVDAAIVNGIFNLNPARETIFRALARVIKPAGTLFAAELILLQPLPPETRASERDWFA